MDELILTEEEKEVLTYWLEAGKEKFNVSYDKSHIDKLMKNLDAVRKKMHTNYKCINITTTEIFTTAIFIHIIAEKIYHGKKNKKTIHHNDMLRSIDGKLRGIVQSDLAE